MENILVSICIPTYNGDKYLRQCLDSCLEQNFKDYEIIICDDGSGDETVAILESYAKRHSLIRFYKNEKNLGLVENWNKCVREARGQWIKFVFQDDYISSNCLSTFVNAIEETSTFMVCARNFVLPKNSGQETFNYYTTKVRTLENTGKYTSNQFSPAVLSSIAIENMCMNFIGEPSLIFFKKELVSKIGYFNTNLKQICDFEFAFRVGINYGITYVPEQLCAFRIHQTSTTSTNLSNNYFILHYIEPLLLSYFFLFDEKYANFRKNLNLFQTFKLKLYFKVKAYHAYKVNVAQKHNHVVFNASNEKFREIRAVQYGSLFTKLVALVK